MIKLRKINQNCGRKTNLNQELRDALIAVRFLARRITGKLAAVSGKGGYLNERQKRISAARRGNA